MIALLRCVLAALIALAAFAAGVAGRDAVVLRATEYWCLNGRCGFEDTSEREPVDCARFAAGAERTAVLLAGGQSNAANYGQAPLTPRTGVFNFNWFDGRCYRARDPLLGPDGNGGNVWTRLADLLVEHGRYARVLIVPIAVGGSSLRRWTPEGDLHRRLVETDAKLDAAGVRVTHVLWHQGERDAALGTRREDYERQFADLHAALRRLGIDAPVYVAVASACHGPGSEAVRAAQRALPEQLEDVRPGPDTDTLDRFVDRYDACHFSDAGLDAHAHLWLEALGPGG